MYPIQEFKKGVAAIIVTYFPKKILLDNIKKLKQECNKILIVDNGSDEESLKLLRSLEKDTIIDIHYNKGNLGIASALNFGLKYAIDKNYEWLLTFDQDSVILTDNYAYEMVQITSKEHNIHEVAVIGGNYPLPIDPKYPNIIKYSPATGKIHSREVNTVITSGNIINLNVIKETDIRFDENLFIDYVDFDFCLALKDKGKRIIQVLDVKFQHVIGSPIYIDFKGQRTIVRNHSYIRKYYYFRNSMVIHKRYAHHKDWVLYSKGHVKKQLTLTLLYEKNKFKKSLVILLALLDAKRGKLGVFEYKI